MLETSPGSRLTGVTGVADSGPEPADGPRSRDGAAYFPCWPVWGR